MRVVSGTDLAVRRGAAAYFTGEVWQELLVENGPHHTYAFRVSFTPGARTAWHTHPAGQLLIVTSGRGLAQKRGEPVQRISAGDTVVIEAGEMHWHGAAPDSPMQHLAIQAAIDPEGAISAEWFEPVSDEDYSR